jgi:hypothetical protein
MHEPRDHFLAYTGLAGDEHLRVRAGRVFDIRFDVANRRADTDERFGAIRCVADHCLENAPVDER